MNTTKPSVNTGLALPLTDKKTIRILSYLCALVYFTSYVTRINYAAVVSEIVRAEGLSKGMVSLAVTGLFITYGVGQLISGYLGDHVRPRYLMIAGLLLASSMNILLPLKPSPYYMLVIWCINGFGQALMWPPIVKLLTGYLSEADYVRATVVVSWGSSLGTIVIYLIAPLFIALSNWKTFFFFCAALGLLGALVVMFGIGAIEKKIGATAVTPQAAKATETPEKPVYTMKLTPFIPVLTFMFIAIALQGSLRDGVTTWMPSYIGETFALGTAISILTGVILPIFSIFSFTLSRVLFNKFVPNEPHLAGYLFIVASLASGILALFSGANPVLSVVCTMLITGCMHGINWLLVCVVPGRFKETGHTSTVSGVLNFATYIGSALSTYGFAALSQRFGWKGTILVWFVVSVAGVLVCLGIAPFWKFGKERKSK